MVSAKSRAPQLKRISQCDLFQDIEIIESVNQDNDRLYVKRITFPYVICLNQDCDLSRDYMDFSSEPPKNDDCRLLHLIVAPVFIFEEFLNGTHWDKIFSPRNKQKKSDTAVKKIINNEDPRYHFLHFPDEDRLPDFIVDFKHFFTISNRVLYLNLSKRICSIDELYREKISQRFAYYFSRIGLPE